MPIIFAAIIGYVRIVTSQGRKLSWVKGSLLYSVFYEKQEPLYKRELMDFLVKSSGSCHVHYPSPGVKWIVNKLGFPVVGCPVIPRFVNISIEWASHFVPRPQLAFAS